MHLHPPTTTTTITTTTTPPPPPPPPSPSGYTWRSLRAVTFKESGLALPRVFRRISVKVEYYVVTPEIRTSLRMIQLIVQCMCMFKLRYEVATPRSPEASDKLAYHG